MQFKERVRRAHNMSVPLAQEVVEEDVIVIAAGDIYYHSSRAGRLPLKKVGDKFYYQDDNSELIAKQIYIIRVNPEHVP